MAVVPIAGGQYRVVRGGEPPPQPPFGSPVTSYTQPSWQLWMVAQLYATQINVRKCVDFLARNAAQVGLHAFRRDTALDRVRLEDDYPLVQWLDKPNPATSTYRLIEFLVADLALYGQAFWLKYRTPDRPLSLVRLPPPEVIVRGGLLPTSYVWTQPAGAPYPYEPGDVVPFSTYNPFDPKCGLPLLVALRRTLEEDAAATEARARTWTNGTRMDGVITRPKEAPKWTPTQRQAFREQLQARHTGPGGGGLLVLEDGMTMNPISFSAKESEYILSRKFSAEEAAALFQIPLPLVGLLDHATFSNIKEQHKQMLTDCLGPYFTLIEQAIGLFLIPEAPDSTKVYVEFNVAEKLKGSFEEQTNSLRVGVGRPFMTPNEARARLNLPRITDDPTADQLAAQQGGPANGQRFDATEPPAAPGTAATIEPVVRAALARQAARLEKLPVDARAAALNPDRCRRELAADLIPLVGRDQALAYAAQVTDQTFELLVERREAFADDRALPPLEVSHAA